MVHDPEAPVQESRFGIVNSQQTKVVRPATEFSLRSDCTCLSLHRNRRSLDGEQPLELLYPKTTLLSTDRTHTTDEELSGVFGPSVKFLINKYS